jgi:1,4-alpha-glucan branching enzyme
MPGDYEQKFANLRILLGFMYMHPGKKLLFMGSELAEWDEWNYEGSLHWNLLDYPLHKGVQRWVADLNKLYRREPALYTSDFSPTGFEWVDFKEWRQNIISFLRRDMERKEVLLAIVNLSAQPFFNYRLGLPRAGHWQELLNSTSRDYGGSGEGNPGSLHTEEEYSHYHNNSIKLTVPALSIMIFKHQSSNEPGSHETVKPLSNDKL